MCLLKLFGRKTYPKECYYCAFVDKVFPVMDAVHCSEGELKGKDAWLSMTHKACKKFKMFQGTEEQLKGKKK